MLQRRMRPAQSDPANDFADSHRGDALPGRMDAGVAAQQRESRAQMLHREIDRPAGSITKKIGGKLDGSPGQRIRIAGRRRPHARHLAGQPAHAMGLRRDRRRGRGGLRNPHGRNTDPPQIEPGRRVGHQRPAQRVARARRPGRSPGPVRPTPARASFARRDKPHTDPPALQVVAGQRRHNRAGLQTHRPHVSRQQRDMPLSHQASGEQMLTRILSIRDRGALSLDPAGLRIKASTARTAASTSAIRGSIAAVGTPMHNGTAAAGKAANQGIRRRLM